MNFLEISSQLLELVDKSDKPVYGVQKEYVFKEKPLNIQNYKVISCQQNFYPTQNRIILINQEQYFITAILGPQGQTLQSIQSQLNVTIQIRNSKVYVYGTDVQVYLCQLLFDDIKNSLKQPDNINRYKMSQFKQMKNDVNFQNQSSVQQKIQKPFEFKVKLLDQKQIDEWVKNKQMKQKVEHGIAVDFYFECLKLAQDILKDTQNNQNIQNETQIRDSQINLNNISKVDNSLSESSELQVPGM